MSDESLNRAIDEVARQMTEGAPAEVAAFRRDVLARIAAGGSPRRSWRAAFVLSPIAVAAALVIAAWAMRGGDTRPIATPAGAIAGLAEHARTLPERAGTGRAGSGLASPETARPHRLPAIGASLADARGALAPREAEPRLDPNDVASIAVAPLAVDMLTPDSIQIPRLDTITPILVDPLDTTDPQRRQE